MNTSTIAILCLALAASSACANQPQPPAEAEPGLAHGTYHVVALRRASGVIGGPEDPTAEGWLGRGVLIGERLRWIDGEGCDEWQATALDMAPLEIDDPNLSDLAIGPVDSPTSTGDARLGLSWQLECEGEHVGAVYQLDERVLVFASPSGLTNAILERPLDSDQIEALQRQLKDMKFYAGEATGDLDEATQRAVSAYADYRGADYQFQRAAITANLLDGLGILSR